MLKLKFITGFAIVIMISVYSSRSYAEEYSSGGKRDPFVPLVGVARAASLQGLDAIYSIDDVSLQGILVGTGGARGAIVNGEVIHEGERKGMFSLQKVSDNGVKVMIGDVVYEIRLYED